jgi:hypothetical protein
MWRMIGSVSFSLFLRDSSADTRTGSSLVVQWVNARLRTGQTTAPFNFQCELAASGAITFYYLTVCGGVHQSALRFR